MGIKEVIETVVGVVLAGGTISLVLKFKSSVKRKEDLNKIHDINQKATSNDQVYQAGRDINVKQ